MSKQIDPYLHPQAPLTTFRIVTMPPTISPFSAVPAHLQARVVQAVNALAATSDSAVVELVQAGYRVIEVSPGAGLTALERDVHARANRAAQDAADPIPSDMLSPNNRAPSPLPNYASRTVAAGNPPALPTWRRGG